MGNLCSSSESNVQNDIQNSQDPVGNVVKKPCSGVLTLKVGKINLKTQMLKELIKSYDASVSSVKMTLEFRGETYQLNTNA